MDTKPVKRSSKKEKRPHKIINISDDSPAVLVETDSHELNTRKPVFENEDAPPKKRRKKSPHSKKTDSQLYEQDLLKSSETYEDGMPTKVAEVGLEDVSSLSLMRSLHNKDLPLQRKIELAHLFVESVIGEQQQQQKQNFDFIKKEKSWMGMPQLVSLICYWIQSVLISSTKQNNTAQNSTNSEKDACLDVRCWVIFKWCLQSKYLERASFPSNLMRTVNFVLSAAAAFPGKTRGNDSRCPLVSDKPIEYEAQTIITGALMKEFAEVVRLLFSLHGRYIRPTLDLWASSALAAAALAERVLSTGVQDDYEFILPNLTCLVLEEFARYLASHSNPRNVFPVIVEKLFEPLLSLLVVLEREQNLEDLCRDGIAYTWRIRLARILEDIFSFGLFHSVHIDGYLNVCKIGGFGESERDMKAKKKSKSASFREREREDSTATSVSYHKSLFKKLEYLRKEGKTTALHGIGRLLSIYICRKKIIGSEKTKISRKSGESPQLINTYKQQQEIPHSRENSSKTSSGTSKNSNMTESKHTAIEQVHTSKHDQATVKPLFNLFVEFMDPLQMDVEHCENVVHLQETQKLQQLSCAHSTLVAINGLLSVVRDEKMFVPTEDTPEQAQFNYLKKIYNAVFKLGALVPTLCLNVMEGFDRMGSNANGKALRSKLQMLDPAFENLPTMIMKEIILALSYLLEIEYRVADGELFDLWLLLLSYSAMNSGKNTKQEKSSMLNSQIVYLGCRIIIIYGELRQVDRSLFRLFESIRLFMFGSYNSTIEKDRRIFFSSINSFPSTLRVEAVLNLACSQGFLNVVADVVSSVPEGQVSKFIKQLKADVSETLEWMKIPLIKDNLKESQIIDFQNQEKQVSSAQAEVIGKAFSELYTLILDKSNVTVNNSKSVGKFVEDIVICISFCLGSFVEKTSDSVEGLWQCILSVITGKEISENDENMKMQARILCGSWILVFIFRLYLSSRSLFRQCISFMPPNSAKESSLAMGDSLTAYSGNDWIKEGGNMIGGYFSWIGKSSIAVQGVLIAISESLEQGGFGKASALMYVLHNIALQRLVDLNRHIKALEFLFDKTARLNLAIAANNDVVCTKFKKGKKLEKLLKVSRQEASTLTDFILNYAFSFVENKFDSKICLVDVPDNSSLYAWDSIIGTMDGYSLVTAVWQLVCQNVDIWSDHASKKSKKKFVSKLLESLLSFQQRVSSDVDFQSAKKQMGNERKVVTIEDTSSELLENDVLYEQEFFCRYLAVKISQKIRKSLPSKLNHLPFLRISPTEADFGNLQDWPKFINILEEVGAIADFEMSLYENTKNYKNVSTVMPVPVFTIEESQAITSCNWLFGDWINLLNLLCWLPKGYGNVTSASVYARHILNIERFLMTTLHQAQKASHSKPFAILQSSGIKDLTEFLDLFLACRRALKSITLSCNDDEFQVRRLSLVPILFESSSSCLWLLRSVDVVAKWFSQCSLLQPSLRGDQEGDANPWKHLIYSILDHTAGMLMIVCEGLFNIAAKSLTFDVQCTLDICKGDKVIDNAQISATDPISERKYYMDVQTSIDVLAKTLSLQARDTLAYFKQISFDVDQDSHESIVPLKSNCNRMDYPKQVSETGKTYCRSWIGVIALTGGIKSMTWGLASALNDLDEKCRKDRTGSLKWQNDLLVKWEHYGEGFECFVNFWIKKLLIVDSDALDEVVVTERDVMSQNDSKTTFGHYRDAELTEINRELIEARFGKGQDSEEEEEKDEAELNGLYGGMDKADDEEGDGDAENDSLLELHASKENVQHATFFEIPYLNKPFLEKLLKGKKPDQATLLGELFMVLAGIIKLKHLSSSPKVFIHTKNSQSTSSAFTNFYIGAAHWLISEASIIMTSGVFSLGWLVGIVRYLESVGSFIPYMNPTFPPMAYAKLINLHLQAMAAVSFRISLEIKNSAPEEVQFSNGNQCSLESTIHRRPSCLKRDNTIFNDLKAALRSSFSMLLKKPLQLHLVMALQSIERALTGAWTGYNIASQLNTGCQSGGNVGLIVAAGVECLDLILDSVSGPKRMKLLAKYSSGFVAALLNVIMHLQGPQIFFVSTFNQCQERNFADPASVILVCVEVLSKFVLRHEVFAMRASHVGQSLALPGVLFQHLCQFKPTQCVSPRTMPLQNQARDFEKLTWLSGGTSAAVRKVSVELCISCCRLLCALLTNYGRESGHCISLLGDSLRIFLFCLEIVDLHTAGKLKANCWTIEEGIKCACWLRRVYEEMGHHKTLGRYRVHILSDYISVVSGCGPAKSGLKREINEALRSGAYALVHACSREDLQQLHVVLGEGPHRIALQTLINDCERYYNYKGKI